MGKYDRLREFLSLHREKEITLALKQIEIVVGSKLPESARRYHAWWSGPSFHPQARNWSDIGWSARVHSKEGSIDYITFKKLKE